MTAATGRPQDFLPGVRRQYQHLPIGLPLYLRTWEAGLAMGLTGAEAGWVLEDNHRMRGPLGKLGAKVYRTDPRGVRGLALRRAFTSRRRRRKRNERPCPTPTSGSWRMRDGRASVRNPPPDTWSGRHIGPRCPGAY